MPTPYKHLRFASNVDWQHVSPVLLRRLDAVGRNRGVRIDVISGYRTRAQQTALYERYRRSGFKIRYIAAKPGTSNHEKGLAVDALIGGTAIGLVVPASAMKLAGLVNPVKGDAPHTELLGGKKGATMASDTSESPTPNDPAAAVAGDPELQRSQSVNASIDSMRFPSMTREITPNTIGFPGESPQETYQSSNAETWRLLSSDMASPDTLRYSDLANG